MTTSNESKTPETDAMTRLYREQVAPVLDTLAAGACTRILNKMGQIERERDQALANYRFMVERAADQKLDGYRELGQRAANAENEAAALRAKLAAIQGELPEGMEHEIMVGKFIGVHRFSTLCCEDTEPKCVKVEIFPSGTRSRLSSLSGMKRGEG